MSYSRKEKSQRQLQVGERIRRILSNVFLHGNFDDPKLRQANITVSEVVPTPDLRKAVAFVSALGKDEDPELIKALNDSANEISYQVAQQLTTKYSPKVYFEYDKSFAKAARIEEKLENLNTTE